MADIIAFNYGQLTKDDGGKLRWFAAEIRKKIGTHVSAGLEIGRLLSESRSVLPSETTFTEWIASEFGFSRSSAYRYIAAFEHFGSCPNLGQIELSAMYELTTNEQAKKKALKLAAKGVNVTHKLAKELLAECAPKPTTRTIIEQVHVPPETVSAIEETPQNDSEVTVEADESGEEDRKEATGTDSPEETDHGPPRNGKDKPAGQDYGQCPNCAGTRWTNDDDGVACSRCHHPHGEPVGDVEEERISLQRSKTVKTVEALMRAFDDLHLLLPAPKKQFDAITACKLLLVIAKQWK